GIRHLVVDALEHRRHLDRHRARHDHQVRVARRCPGHHAETLDVEARREGRHHLDGAAGEPERHGPYRRLARPVEEPVGDGRQRAAAGKVVNPLGDLLEQGRVLVPRLRAALVVLLPLLKIFKGFPDGDGNLGHGRLYFHSSMPSRYAYAHASPRMATKPSIAARPCPPSARIVSAHGKRKTASVSKTRKMSATR